mmetsp:Transcript_67524/g.113136  ORF Transcript_67524/g.113136 Transcript_67524/m.113136 type:complete len:472 (+) Transcript_67524:1475-2890(+)
MVQQCMTSGRMLASTGAQAGHPMDTRGRYLCLRAPSASCCSSSADTSSWRRPRFFSAFSTSASACTGSAAALVAARRFSTSASITFRALWALATSMSLASSPSTHVSTASALSSARSTAAPAARTVCSGSSALGAGLAWRVVDCAAAAGRGCAARPVALARAPSASRLSRSAATTWLTSSCSFRVFSTSASACSGSTAVLAAALRFSTCSSVICSARSAFSRVMPFTLASSSHMRIASALSRALSTAAFAAMSAFWGSSSSVCGESCGGDLGLADDDGGAAPTACSACAFSSIAVMTSRIICCFFSAFATRSRAWTWFAAAVAAALRCSTSPSRRRSACWALSMVMPLASGPSTHVRITSALSRAWTRAASAACSTSWGSSCVATAASSGCRADCSRVCRVWRPNAATRMCGCGTTCSTDATCNAVDSDARCPCVAPRTHRAPSTAKATPAEAARTHWSRPGASESTSGTV